MTIPEALGVDVLVVAHLVQTLVAVLVDGVVKGDDLAGDGVDVVVVLGGLTVEVPRLTLPVDNSRTASDRRM